MGRDWQELLERVDACGVPRQQLHEAEWELLKRSEEIWELQQVETPSVPDIKMPCLSGSLCLRYY